MRRSLWWWGPITSIAALAVASGAAAQTAPQLDIHIERDLRPRTAASTLGVFHTVTLTDRATGQAPSRPWVVYGQATNNAGEQTAFQECDRAIDTDSRATPGVYNCSLYLDRGGSWDFTAIVRERREKPGEVTSEVARASVPFELVSDLVVTEKETQFRTSSTTVILLWLHVLVTTLWFALVALLVALALPEARHRLSSFGLHRLERRLDVLVKLTWSSTAGVLATGVYLLLEETAYKTPFTSARVHATFALPYAKPYFVALATKLSLYAVMMLAVVQLARGARRHLRAGAGARRAEPSRAVAPTLEMDGPASASHNQGAVATMTAPVTTPNQPCSQLEPVTSRLSRIAVAVLLVGALGISFSVTLLKYFHQIIEAVPR